MRSSDVVEQLQILLKENGVRIRQGDGYHYQIKTLIDLFTAPQEFTEQEQEVVGLYLDSLNTLVEEIYQALQTMRYEDLAHGYLLDSGSHKFGNIFYDLSKVFEYIHNPSYIPSLVDYHLNRLIESGVLPKYVTRATDKRDLQLLLLSKLADNVNGN